MAESASVDPPPSPPPAPVEVAEEALTAAPVPALYVGDLHPDVADGQLVEHFSSVGEVASVRVCRDTLSGQSLGYGYVNFTSPTDASDAIEKLNHTPLNGRLIRVMWSYRDSELRKSGIGNLFVKNLNESIDNVGLHDIFSKFGSILSCKVATFPDGKSKGYGFVQFDTQNAANAAIDDLNGSVVEGKQIYVGHFIKKSERMLHGSEATYTNLYMKNLDLEVAEEILWEKFSEFGKITNLTIVKDDNGNSRGFGFVNFDNPEDAKKAMEAMNGKKLGSKALYVARAQKKVEREEILRHQYEEKQKEQFNKFKASNIYIKNIDDDVDDDALREHFSKCGTITSAKIMRDDKGISKGFGFVCFSNPEEASKAVSTLHGCMFHGKPLYVAIAQKKEERQAQLQQQYAQQIAGLVGSSAAVVPAVYPPIFYPPAGVMPQIPPQQGLVFQHMGMRPGWRPGGFTLPARPAFQSVTVPMVPGSPRQHRQNRGRLNGYVHPQAGQAMSYTPNYQPPSQSTNSLKDTSSRQRGGYKYPSDGRHQEMNNGLAVVTSGSAPNAQGTEMLSSMLAAASPQQQKQMLGERLFPLVQNIKFDLAAKITGMLLEMDNSELLLLLESPEALSAKVEEAVQVLKISKVKVGSGQENHQPNYLSSEVSAN
ncbi:putative polyadenylate-binding protein [Acorus calamus]|uniref:Polyadenylate-binding protein n=1 Tax=Acorus calamus TaxID=4465 RepID=A0AAV9C0E4_ACOCL|nr:putative polyadenylate-binding protein [Acorus calamus]